MTDSDEQSVSGTIRVEVHDDVPTIDASDVLTSLRPGDSGNNLQRVDETISFTKDEQGEPLEVGDNVQTEWWGGSVRISATKVTYQGYDEWKNPSIVLEDPTNMSLSYSPYNNYGWQSYAGTPPQADIDNKTAFYDKSTGTWYRKAPVEDWGLTVNGGANNWEIQAEGNTSEAVVIELDGLAYGFTVKFGAFFSGGTNNGTGYDTKSEKALITFYKGKTPVFSKLVEGSDTGEFVYNTGDVLLEGFDKVIISAVDNSEDSDFTIQSFDFVTKRDDPVSISEGTVTAESGADGFAEEYEVANVKFDLEGMVQKGNLNEEGTSGTIIVQINGELQTVKLELSEGSGESILTGTIVGTKEQLFTATLDQDGHWTMEHYEQFRVLDEDGRSSNEFELVFKTEDSDGDIATTTVNVPLEVKEQDTNIYGEPIGNNNDTITITGNEGDGVAGTIVAGDTGGMTEGQQVEANYNVCFILDTSGSMEEKVGEKPQGKDTHSTRIDIAVESIQNFIDSSIHNGDFVGTVNLSVVTFASSYGQTIEVSITRALSENGSYTEIYNFKGQQYNYEQFKTLFSNELDLPPNGGTNYEAGFHHAADWFEKLDTSNADGNITYFLTDGVPTYHDDSQRGGGNYAIEDDVQGAWKGYQELLDSAPGMQVNAIGFGERAESSRDNGLTEEAMKTLAMFDNTATPVSDVEWNQKADGKLYYGTNGKEHCTPKEEVYKEYEGTPSHSYGGPTYYALLPDGSYQELEWAWEREPNGWPWEGEYVLGYRDENGTWHAQIGNVYVTEEVPVSVTGGNATQVTNGQSLTTVFTNGFRPGTLDGAGNDVITAAESTSSVIVFGDVMNTDQLLHELKELKEDQLNGTEQLPDYGSGKEVFQWLETNGSNLVDTKFDGWTHDDSIKYMLQHAKELGCETRVAENGTTYLVTVDGTVLNLDGTEAQDVTLDSLTGRDGGSDTIIGSSASDTIYGQEGNDLLIGDPSDNLNDLKNVTVSDIESMKTEDEAQFEDFLSRVEGTEGNGDDMLFGGTGDDVLIGMGGDDYLNGGEGKDAIFGGAGNDIIVYDQNDYMVSGGFGINFMVTNEENVDLNYLLTKSGRVEGNGGPIVDGIDVLIKGDDALSLTNMDQLASEYGISINQDGNLELDATKWTESNGTFTNEEANLTLETTLTPQTSTQNETLDQQVIILQHTTG